MDQQTEGQGTFDAFSVLRLVETAAQRVRLDNAHTERMVGVAPYALKVMIEEELSARRMRSDADAWLRNRDIDLHWAVTGATGATGDASGASFMKAPPLRELMLWPAAR